MNTRIDLSKHRIGEHDVFYIPNFVTSEEEDYLTRKISETPEQKWKVLANRRLQVWGGEITTKGILLSRPLPSFVDGYPDIVTRLRNTGAFSSSPHGAPNHVILNEYLPGQGIMPHEDGPRYYPVVATISLGSHSVFDYYRYKSEDHTEATHSVPHGEGKVINTIPVLSVVLERRSLIISSGAMYTSHLHGIKDNEEDRILPHDTKASPISTEYGVYINNWFLLGDPEMRRAIERGEPLKRGTRYSLTCRDVDRVLSATSLLWR